MNHLEALKRRSDYLGRRIEENKKAGKRLTWDEKEYGALLWAIEELREKHPEELRSKFVVRPFQAKENAHARI